MPWIIQNDTSQTEDFAGLEAKYIPPPHLQAPDIRSGIYKELVLIDDRADCDPEQKQDLQPDACVTNESQTVVDELSGHHMLQHASPDILTLRSRNPLKPPDWRWHVAKHLAKRATWSAQLNADEHVHRAYDFQRKLAECYSHEDLQDIAESESPWCDMLPAFMLWRQADRRRHELEARLLAKQPHEEISQIMGISTLGVQWYAWWFFDFADAPSAVTHTIIQPYGESLHPAYALWKTAGYWGGADAVDVLVSPIADPIKLQKTMPFFSELVRSRLSYAALVASLTIDVEDPVKARKVIRLFERERRLAMRAEALESQQSGSVADNVAAFFAGVRDLYRDKVDCGKDPVSDDAAEVDPIQC